MTVDGSVRMTETSCRALNPLITRHSSLVTTVPTHGSAIKSHRKPWRFNYLQFSNRR